MDSSPKKTSGRRRKKVLAPIVVRPPANIDYPGFSFDILHRDPKSRARLGRLTTPHGAIETPNYIFCGTKAAIKNFHILPTGNYRLQEVWRTDQ